MGARQDRPCERNITIKLSCANEAQRNERQLERRVMRGRTEKTMPEWKDTSTFSQGDKVRTPNCWRISGGGVTIILHRHIHYEKDDWLMSCEPWFTTRMLQSKDVDDAKAEALQKVKTALSEAHGAFGA